MSEHERIVLGSMMTTGAAIEDATEVITGSDFADYRHERIFDAIVGLHSESKPTDPVAVADRLGDEAKKCGGAVYLLELVGSVAVAASVGYYADKVRAASMVRKVSEVGARLGQLAEVDTDALDLVNAARAELDALVMDDRAEVSNEQAVYDAIESLEQPIGMSTPWKALDDMVSGWAPGMLYIAGARPGIGKTVLGICAVLDAARRGATTVLFSLEMPKNELYLRMLSNVGSVNGERILHRSLRGDDHTHMAKAAAHISQLGLLVDDRSALSLAQMRAKVRGIQRTRPVGLVVVDYLGLVKPPPDAPRHDRRVQVDAIAQGLKNLARDLQVPILALAQLNRGIEGRADKVPTMADLRESGGIEAAADVVMLMHRVIADDPEDLHIVMGKNRHGPQSSFRLIFRGEFSRIEDQRSPWVPASAYREETA